MTTENLISFTTDTPVEEASKVMSQARNHYYPLLEKNGCYCGLISRRLLMNVMRKDVILVDHNQHTEAVDNLEEAHILEVIDHHRLGVLETNYPVYFRNEPVGCTATIIYRMYQEYKVEISAKIAGLLMSAILSDTLLFHSPTCTMFDRDAAEELAKIAGEDIKTYGQQMFEAGEDLSGRTAENLLQADCKEFTVGDIDVQIGQGFFLNEHTYDTAKELVRNLLPDALKASKSEMIFYMLTSVPEQSTLLLFCGEDSEELVKNAFQVEAKDGMAYLPGIVSRKKQLVPPLRETLLRM